MIVVVMILASVLSTIVAIVAGIIFFPSVSIWFLVLASGFLAPFLIAGIMLVLRWSKRRAMAASLPANPVLPDALRERGKSVS